VPLAFFRLRAFFGAKSRTGRIGRRGWGLFAARSPWHGPCFITTLQTVVGAAAFVPSDARKIAGMRRALTRAQDGATVPMTASAIEPLYLKMMLTRFAAAYVVFAMVATGAAPCTTPASATPVPSHEACERMGSDAAGTTVPTPAHAPDDCCVSPADSRVPPTAPATVGHNDRSVVANHLLVPFAGLTPASALTDRDLRARSAPRSRPISVLLI